MFIYLLQVREAVHGRPEVVVFFTIFASAVWFVWLAKMSLSRHYRPWAHSHETTASIVIPVVDEPLDLFAEVLQRIVKQEPHEVIVVINGPANQGLEEVCERADVAWTWTPVAGKRNAVREAMKLVTGDITVLVDSDTLWTDTVLEELCKPFADRRIGGVSTKQRILDPRRSFFSRWADWMENSRARYSMPAQSVLGQVGCLPGRTIALRSEIIVEAMPEFMHGRFLGAFVEVSDDRTLTNLCLKQGYRTVFQSTSLVYTDAPLKLKKMYKQQLRWSRGSQYNTLRMLPWMIGHAPMLAFFYVMDVILPFLFLGCVLGWLWHAWTGTGVNLLSPTLEAFPGPAGWVLAGSVILIGSTLSMWLRQARHLHDEPRDWLWMPAYILFSSFFLMPIRILGFVRMAHVAGWGTRDDAYTGKRAHRRLNPQAAIPYLIAAVLIGAEIALITRL